MDPALLGVSTAFGLAAAAGLNTTLPLLIVGVLGRLGLLGLAAPFDTLTFDVTLLGLALLAVFEVVSDKVPGWDSAVHAIQWPLAAAAGAILFASQSAAINWVSPEITVLIGVVTAGGVHAVRMAVRPLVTGASIGMGNPLLSAAEDVYAVVLAVAAVFAPALALLFLALLLGGAALATVVVRQGGGRLGRKTMAS